jgi:hypothetical protein
MPSRISSGPYYCPSGCSWSDLDKIIHELRTAGNSVHIRKYPISEKDSPVLFGNTHRVWLLIADKRAPLTMPQYEREDLP